MSSPEPPRFRPSTRDLVVWGVLTLGAVVLVWMGIHRRHAAPPKAPLRVYAEVPPFRLTNRDGTSVGLEDLLGDPWIADFIFTRCAGICPFMTRQMYRLAGEIPNGAAVHRVSFTVDPENDTPEVLATYAASYGAEDDWYFLTGPLEEIRNLSREGFLLGLENASPEDPNASLEPIIHSNRFVLVDGAGKIRGYYDAFDDNEIRRLLDDLGWLLERGGS